MPRSGGASAPAWSSAIMGDMNTPPALQVDDLCVSYGPRTVLKDVCLSVPPGGSVAIMGKSGSGKSTLLSCVLGMQRPDVGEIRVGGELVKFRGKGVARIRREEIGVIFQSGELLPELSPLENVMISGLLAGRSVLDARSHAEQLLTTLEVPLSWRAVTEFSGGEQQRIAVARALMNEPRLVIADEPTGSLDPETRGQVIDVLFALPKRYGCGLVVVTHDPVVARPASRTLNLVDSALVPADLVGAAHAND